MLEAAHMEIEDILMQMEMLSEGIVPYHGWTFVDINKALDTLSPKDRRRAKRKFRKLWRKAAATEDRQSGGHGFFLSTTELCAASHGKSPSRSQRRSRSAVVRRYLSKRGTKK